MILYSRIIQNKHSAILYSDKVTIMTIELTTLSCPLKCAQKSPYYSLFIEVMLKIITHSDDALPKICFFLY